jgi:hypothetical protein
VSRQPAGPSWHQHLSATKEDSMQEHEVRELMDRLVGAMDPAVEYEARH